MKVFIVEDDQAYAKMLSFRLNQAVSENLMIFESGEECLENLNKNPDLVILDFSLGGLNGLDTLRQIKKEVPRTEVIVMTALNNEKLAKECKDEGALDYLVKSEESLVKIQELTAKLNRGKNRKRIQLAATIILLVVIFLIFILT